MIYASMEFIPANQISLGYQIRAFAINAIRVDLLI